MLSSDYDRFRAVIEDLCTAFDRPFTDARARVFFEDLKDQPLERVIAFAKTYRKSGRRMPTPSDLRPAPGRVGGQKQAQLPLPEMSEWAIAANKILLAIAYFDRRRGFEPVRELMPSLLAAKADYVRMAQQAEADGDKWPEQDFNRMCREGFEKILGTRALAA